MGVRPFGVVQHEAAHVVVGVALGAKFRGASVARWSSGTAGLGWTWFPRTSAYQDALIAAAGIAWERAVDGVLHRQDEADLRAAVGKSRADFEACVTAAAAILESRAAAHVLVTRALLESDLTGDDIRAIARGEKPRRHSDD